MKTYILSAAIFFQSFFAGAQVYDTKTIHADDNLSDYTTYRFPSFEEATIHFKTGSSAVYKMNFNTLLCIMQFIDPKGDTLEISKPEEIDSIRLNNHTFFFMNGFLEIIEAYDSVKLVVSRKASFEPVKIGAMGLPAHSVSIDDYDNYNSTDKNTKTIKLHANQDINIHEKTEYFLVSNKGEFIKAGKTGFLKIFNADKKRIEDFLKLNKPDFNKQDDLEKLFHFCTRA